MARGVARPSDDAAENCRPMAAMMIRSGRSALPRRPTLKPWQFLAYEMRLDPRRADRELLNLASKRLIEKGLRLSTLLHEIDAGGGALRRVFALHCECFRRQPPSEVRPERVPFQLWQWAALESVEAAPDAYFIAVAGSEYVGLSAPARPRRLPGVLECRFTGVATAYGARGVGLALTAAVVGYGFEHGYTELRSTVLAQNVPMLRINEALGFRRHRQFIQSYPQLAAARTPA
jgi:RimJ/RimL family protein N-acetyltransferase